MWGLVICIKMFTNVYLNKVLFIPCEVISLHPRRLMLSESPAVGSVHGHRVGRAAQSRREWTGSADGPRLVDAHPPPPLVPDREQGHGCCRPPLPPPHGARAALGSRGGRMSRLCQDRGCSSSGREGIADHCLSTWRKPPRRRMERNSTRDPRGPASPSTVVASECEM